MNNDLREWAESLIKGACFNCEEIAMRNIELEKEVKALRLILQSHGEIVEMNAKLQMDKSNERTTEEFWVLQGLYENMCDEYRELMLLNGKLRGLLANNGIEHEY
jgi:hypothetical protein